MRIGVIIIFRNNESDIDAKFFIEHLKEGSNLELCLVNNASIDNTYEKLKEIKESCSTHVSLIDIKKFKSDVFAVRSGARFMFNQFDLNHIGYFNTNLLSLKRHNLNGLIKAISKNQDVILNYNIKVIEKKEMKQTLFESVFSIIEYLEKLKIDDQIINLQA